MSKFLSILDVIAKGTAAAGSAVSGQVGQKLEIAAALAAFAEQQIAAIEALFTHAKTAASENTTEVKNGSSTVPAVG